MSKLQFLWLFSILNCLARAKQSPQHYCEVEVSDRVLKYPPSGMELSNNFHHKFSLKDHGLSSRIPNSYTSSAFGQPFTT